MAASKKAGRTPARPSSRTGGSTRARRPSDRPSKEATKRGLELAQKEGDAYGKAATHLIKQVAKGGSEKRAGEYLVAYSYEDPEGLYHWRDGALHWQEPQDENVHLEVAVRDGADGRLVYGVRVTATLARSDDSGGGRGERVGPVELPFLWHPSIHHYGANVRVPGDGEYTLHLHIEPPTYSRHDKVNGKRFARPVDVEFDGVQLEVKSK